ncbi:Aldo/keto reductase [Carnobacterium iners]|uniref:Aldo/keto reductase n=1 Tax=Carnobacterium iners TaxID=1073423 RepID=A0A1X7MNL9_9LACT|nr:aldo/keto reductase [Carnobacterium iners]SEK77277.1 Aldo/keto reductase [Carnobacterium iners]SMH26432.1 Aldo/keto reductase [Carnobacterium iners]
METVTLANGTKMPLVGTGTNTYGKVENQYKGDLNNDFRALESAIKAGYRLIDTAIYYRNEAGVGQTIKDSGIAREEFYLTTKIPEIEEYIGSKEIVEQALLKSLENLQTDYIDLYLIHQPIEDKKTLKRTWQVLESFVDAGKIKSIGVSNFSIRLLEEMKVYTKIQPAVNQIESNPSNWNNELIDYLKNQLIIPEAWGPLSRVTEEQRAKLTTIGDKYGKNWGQVLLRYQIQRKVVVIPKSHNIQRQLSNLELFDFNLSTGDIQIIETL